jgi:hypothetical protein
MLELPEGAQFAPEGRPSKESEENPDNVRVNASEGGNSAAYLAARLKKAGRDDLLAGIRRPWLPWHRRPRSSPWLSVVFARRNSIAIPKPGCSWLPRRLSCSRWASTVATGIQQWPMATLGDQVSSAAIARSESCAVSTSGPLPSDQKTGGGLTPL